MGVCTAAQAAGPPANTVKHGFVRPLTSRDPTNLQVHLRAVQADGLNGAVGIQQDGAAGGLVHACLRRGSKGWQGERVHNDSVSLPLSLKPTLPERRFLVLCSSTHRGTSCPRSATPPGPRGPHRWLRPAAHTGHGHCMCNHVRRAWASARVLMHAFIQVAATKQAPHARQGFSPKESLR